MSYVLRTLMHGFFGKQQYAAKALSRLTLYHISNQQKNSMEYK